MPVTVGLSAGVGAYLGSVGALGTLSALGGALLYGGLASAQYLLRQQPRAPQLQSARTARTIRAASENARTIYGRRRISGVMMAFEANKATVEGVTRPDGQNNATEIGKSRYWSFPLYLASHPLDGIEAAWINGISQLEADTAGDRAGRLSRAIARTGPDTFLIPLGQTVDANPAPHSLDDADEWSIIIPPRDGQWGIGHGHGDDDYYGSRFPDRENTRLSGTARNLEWGRWPWMLHPRITGYGKPPWGGPRSGNGWWDYRKQRQVEGDGQRSGPDGFAYVVADWYQNSRDDEDVERLGYNWNSATPEVELLVRGKRIALPDENGVEQGPVWTDNVAAVLWDYVRTELAMPIQGLDVAMWRDAIAYCDEEIADQGVEADDPREISASRTVKRGPTGAAVVSGDPPERVLREMAFCMDGSVTTSGGLLAVQPGRLREVTHDIPADDMLPTLAVQAQPPTLDRANRASMRLVQSSLHGWGPHEMAEVWNEAGERNDGAPYRTDLGERAYMVSPVHAHIMMEAELQRIRIPSGLRMAPVYTLQCVPGPRGEHLTIRELDRITFSYPPLGLVKTEIEVLSIKRLPNWTVTIVGRGNASVAPSSVPIFCPGHGDAPPPYPSAARGHIGTLYGAPSPIIYTVRQGST